MTYIDPRGKVLSHLDRLAAWKAGDRPAPVTLEWDLSNRCVLGCKDCLTGDAMVTTLNRGSVSIADIQPGEFVLGYDEREQRPNWTRVVAASDRPFTGDLFTIQIGRDVLRATGNHPFLTQHGWLVARQLTAGDQVVHVSEALRLRVRSDDRAVRDAESNVLAGEEASAERVRLRMWSVGEDARSEGVQGPLHAGHAGSDQSFEALEQSDEASGSGGEGVCRQEGREAAGHFGAADQGLCGRSAEESGHVAGTSSAVIGAHAPIESDEAPGDCGEGGVYFAREWRIRTKGRGDAQVLGRESGLQGACGRAHALAEPDGRLRHQREESESDAPALAGIATGAVVRSLLHAGEFSGVVHGHRGVLGEGSESRLQGSRSETRDRGDGRLQPDTRSTYGQELRGAHDSSLSEARIRVLGGDVAGEASEQNDHVAGQPCVRDADLSVRWAEHGLELRQVDRVESLLETAFVYNLETDAGTYIANDTVVHNCHFAYTHVRGPWMAKDRALPTAQDKGGDLAFADVVMRTLTDVKRFGVKSIVWTGGGEPTTHPSWQAIVDHAHSVGLEQGMYTLGGLLTATSARFLAERASWVVVSLDAPDEATYAAEKGVPPSRFAAALNGIDWLGGYKAAVGVSFLLHEGNWFRAEEMLRLARLHGATYATFRPTIRTVPSDQSKCVDDRLWITEAMPTLTALAAEPDVELDPHRFAQYRDWQKHPYSACYGIRMSATITPDARVWVCPNRREFEGSCLGDLKKESFASIWARHPGSWTDFADCRVMCRLHAVNESLHAVYQPRQHEAFI